MTEQDNTRTDRELLDSVAPLTLEIPILLTLDEWTIVLASLETLAVTDNDRDTRDRIVDAAIDVRQQMFDSLHDVKDALLKTRKLHEYYITLVERP